MIPKRSLVASSTRRKFIEERRMGRHLMQAAAREIWMASQYLVKSSELGGILQRMSVSAIQLGNLLGSEVLEIKPSADIKGRLINVSNKEVCFRRIRYRHGELLPRTS